jgi:hypothetical protein
VKNIYEEARKTNKTLPNITKYIKNTLQAAESAEIAARMARDEERDSLVYPTIEEANDPVKQAAGQAAALAVKQAKEAKEAEKAKDKA